MKNFFVKFIAKFLILSNILLINSLALAQTPITTDSRIRTLVYNPNEVYELKFYYNYQSFIEFANDEEIEMISVGEAFSWRLTPAGKRLFVRPLEIAAHTNMTIITNKRIYHFDIRSDEFTGKADEDLVYTVRFFYPQIGQPLPIPPQLAVPNVAAKPRQLQEATPPLPELSGIIKTPMPKARVDQKLPGIIERNPDDAILNFDYRFSGESDNIMPLKVYDDGNETHFQFANDNLVIPTISAVDPYGIETPVNYTIRDRYVVVPIVSRQFTLRLADSMLCIYNAKNLLPE
ncbi:MAG: TrbG/VirB9 family P-type conjugative transfer protein [Rickettsiales bacterium]